jgi:hypothetical protein
MFPLLRQQVGHLFMQVTDFQFGLPVARAACAGAPA